MARWLEARLQSSMPSTGARPAGSCRGRKLTLQDFVALYQDLFTDAFKLQRQKHALATTDRGLLLCNGFTGCHSASGGVTARRLRWSESQNVALIHATGLPAVRHMTEAIRTRWVLEKASQAQCQKQLYYC